MKKLFLILLCAIFVSCEYGNPKPIEKYQGKGLVLVEEPLEWNSNKTILTLKNSDSIFEIAVHPFDAKNLKVGDTLK